MGVPAAVVLDIEIGNLGIVRGQPVQRDACPMCREVGIEIDLAYAEGGEILDGSWQRRQSVRPIDRIDHDGREPLLRCADGPLHSLRAATAVAKDPKPIVNLGRSVAADAECEAALVSLQ